MYVYTLFADNAAMNEDVIRVLSVTNVIAVVHSVGLNARRYILDVCRCGRDQFGTLSSPGDETVGYLGRKER